jgi:trk system potassium uptake protein TrkA
LLEVTLADGSPVDGKTVREIEFPADSSLVAIVRDGHVIAPRGETPLHAGDEVLALASIQAETDLKRALTGD